MPAMKATFFEDPAYVYAALVVAEFVLVVVWLSRRNRRWATMLVVPLILGGAVFGLERLVVTDREELVAAAGQIAQDFEAASTAAAERYLDDDLRGSFRSKRAALAAGRLAIERYGLAGVRFTKLEVRVSGLQATMHASTIILFNRSDIGPGRVSLIWDVHWIKRPQGWRIIEVKKPVQGLEF